MVVVAASKICQQTLVVPPPPSFLLHFLLPSKEKEEGRVASLAGTENLHTIYPREGGQKKRKRTIIGELEHENNCVHQNPHKCILAVDGACNILYC